MVRIKRLRYTLEPLKVEDAMYDPYRVKILRKASQKKSMNFMIMLIKMFIRLSMAVLFEYMDIGLRKVKDKIVLPYSKIHHVPNYMRFI